jgi:hypothetical protein
VDVLNVTIPPPRSLTVVLDDGDNPINVTLTQAAPLQVTVGAPRGAPGPPGPAGASAVEFTFATPAATWTIRHNLGRRPTVQLLDATGAQFDGDVEFPDLNTVVVTHAQPIAGAAQLI